MDAIVRAAALRGLPALIDRLGGDGAELFTRYGVPVDAPEDDDAFLASTVAATLLEVAADETGAYDLGLQLAGRQDVAVLGPLAFAIENSPTLGDALDCATRFLFVHSPVLTISMTDDPAGVPGVAGLLYSGIDPEPLPPQGVDVGLGLMHRIIHLLAGGSYGLRSVQLPHPPLAPVSRYTDFFDADVRFDQPAAVLRVPAGLRTMAVPGGNPALRDITVQYIESHFTAPGQSLGERVRLLLTRSLGTAPVTVTAVARTLGTHPRTLQRQLAAEHTTFETVLDEVRQAAAYRLITETDLTFAQVTAMVGFTEQSALSRAVRRWFGDSPRHLRASAGR